jgi:hypothetical protein
MVKNIQQKRGTRQKRKLKPGNYQKFKYLFLQHKKRHRGMELRNGIIFHQKVLVFSIILN